MDINTDILWNPFRSTALYQLWNISSQIFNDGVGLGGENWTAVFVLYDFQFNYGQWAITTGTSNRVWPFTPVNVWPPSSGTQSQPIDYTWFVPTVLICNTRGDQLRALAKVRHRATTVGLLSLMDVSIV